MSYTHSILLVNRILNFNPDTSRPEPDHHLDYILESELEFSKFNRLLLERYVSGTVLTQEYNTYGDYDIIDIKNISHTDVLKTERGLYPGERHALQSLFQQIYHFCIPEISLHPIVGLAFGHCFFTKNNKRYILASPTIDNRTQGAPIFHLGQPSK